MWQGKVGENFPLESSWKNSVGEKGKMRERKEKKEKKEEEKRSEKLHLLFRIYGYRAVGFRRSKRQCSSMRPRTSHGYKNPGFSPNFER